MLRIQRELSRTLATQTGSTLLERVNAIFGVARACAQTVIQCSHPSQRDENIRIMREALGLIMLDLADPRPAAVTRDDQDEDLTE